MYEIIVKHHFSSAHRLINYDGECRNLHGHNWKIKVYARAGELNDIGISMDFKEFKKIVREEIDKYDHVFLNEHPDFEGINPTAENIARILFQKLSQKINDGVLKIFMIEVWESDNNGMRYFQ
ncbi:MAG TPA: 6-carboxytetrahydropterin synthase QueD [Clostridiales bacterium]|nr:6-carboxytetrahydropterin synthase QueD [Clostridiales bacterium]HQP69473.1 6-carboxytetrahydropterin synthase QueD [Clostridiales bacterium]